MNKSALYKALSDCRKSLCQQSKMYILYIYYITNQKHKKKPILALFKAIWTFLNHLFRLSIIDSIIIHIISHYPIPYIICLIVGMIFILRSASVSVAYYSHFIKQSC